jgi:hypothetical protein
MRGLRLCEKSKLLSSSDSYDQYHRKRIMLKLDPSKLEDEMNRSTCSTYESSSSDEKKSAIKTESVEIPLDLSCLLSYQLSSIMWLEDYPETTRSSLAFSMFDAISFPRSSDIVYEKQFKIGIQRLNMRRATIKHSNNS